MRRWPISVASSRSLSYVEWNRLWVHELKEDLSPMLNRFSPFLPSTEKHKSAALDLPVNTNAKNFDSEIQAGTRRGVVFPVSAFEFVLAQETTLVLCADSSTVPPLHCAANLFCEFLEKLRWEVVDEVGHVQQLDSQDMYKETINPIISKATKAGNVQQEEVFQFWMSLVRPVLCGVS